MGLLDGIGQLLDPAGIFSNNGGQQSDMNKIFDPLGLFPMIKGEVDKAAHPDGANGRTDVKAGASKVMDILNQGKDVASQFQSDPTSGDASQQSVGSDEVTTEFVQSPNTDQVTAGYAEPEQSSVQAGDDAAPVSSSSAMTAEDDCAPVIQQSAATAIDPETKTQLESAQAMINYFSAYKNSTEWDRDDWADMSRLDTILQKGDQPPALVAAAAYFKDHPDQYQLLVGLSGSTNGSFNVAGLMAYAQKVAEKAAAQMQGTPPPGQGVPVAPPPPGQDKLPPSNSPPRLPPPSNPPTGTDTNVGGVNKDFTSGLAEPRSIDDLVQYFDGTLANLDEEMTKLGIKAANGDKTAEAQLTALSRRYQDLMELRKQMYTLLSDLSKSFHDMSMHAIGNIR
ncbi:MAG: hypothetical protein IPJ65_06635 [Archangiaceae bacterium]|nr:hypothetical protein [Archangiaceae bacterium]